jgi:activator of HSP90 ATPase
MKNIIFGRHNEDRSTVHHFNTIGLMIVAIAFSHSAVLAQENATPKSITIHQEIDFKVSPQRLYEALLDSKQFSSFSGRAAEISQSVGGPFSLFDKHIVGQNVELVPNQRIVQAWRVVDWPAGIYSIARFEFKPQGEGTKLVFDHTAFPEDLKEHLAEGWQTNYWNLLTKYFK